MSVDLRGKVVFVTGSSIGIGREIACAFAAAGANLAITYYEHREEAEATAARARKLGAADVVVLPFDAADDESIREVVEALVEHFGGLDILVSNAGTVVWKPFLQQGFGEIEAQLRVNVEGVLKVTWACLPLLRDAIINIGSTATLHTSHTPATYVAGKWAVRGFTKALAHEYPDKRVFCIHPTVTATRMNDYRGMAPERVAEVVVKVARGELDLPSGGDVDMRQFA